MKRCWNSQGRFKRRRAVDNRTVWGLQSLSWTTMVLQYFWLSRDMCLLHAMSRPSALRWLVQPRLSWQPSDPRPSRHHWTEFQWKPENRFHLFSRFLPIINNINKKFSSFRSSPGRRQRSLHSRTQNVLPIYFDFTMASANGRRAVLLQFFM